MPSVNLISVVRRTCMASMLAFSLCGIPAHAAHVTVDGDLTDMISLLGAYPEDDDTIVNYFRGTDPMGVAPAEDSNHGFDIKNVYAYYDFSVDTFFFGMNFWGTVGDSQPVTNTTATTEGFANAGPGSNDRNAFDANESYGIQIFLGSDVTDPRLLFYEIKGVNLGSPDDSSVSTFDDSGWGLSVTRAVSVANNGVEFGVTGLFASGAIPQPHPNTVTLRFLAGSSDPVAAMVEDERLVTMQVIPVPAAVWLFGSGLVGIFAVARKRRNKA